MDKRTTITVTAVLALLTPVLCCQAAERALDDAERSARVASAMKLKPPPAGKQMPISAPGTKAMDIRPATGKMMPMQTPPPSARPPLPQ